MTDNEIIKALECCGHSVICERHTCPFAGEEDCVRSLVLAALSLINRQQAEIERLSQRIHFIVRNYIQAPIPMASWLRDELTEYVKRRCMEEL